MSPKRPHGSLRRSQILTTYGPGAMVDLPTRSILISGLESWSDGGRQPVHEDRLVRRLEAKLDVAGLTLATPPGDDGGPLAPYTGITGWVFPEWFVGPYEPTVRESAATPDGGAPRVPGVRSRPLVHREKLVDGKYKKKEVVPIRFVQACVNGHIDDLPWYEFVHGPDDKCRRQLWVDERGTTGDLTNITIRCDCGKQRSMATAEMHRRKNEPGEDDQRRAGPLGLCRGRRPWLGPRSQERCVNDHGDPEVNRLLVRSASNAWFSETLSAISIPDADAELMQAIESIWPSIEGVTAIGELPMARKFSEPVRLGLADWTDERVWEAMERKRRPGLGMEKGLKQAELEMLLESADELGADTPEGDFYARRLRLPDGFAYGEQIERVVLVHRLREVMALLGFTRFEAPVPDEDGELGLDVRRASIAKDLTWLPAIENRGEGIFIAFREEAIRGWLDRPAVKERWAALVQGQDRWHRRHPKFRGVLPGQPYILLHTLSHMLMTSVALECGYSASSIRERIYALPEVGYGILLYTGTTDAEGTLGGLVQVGRSIDEHLALALERGRLCSHDPVCAYHEPANPHEERFLHGAACHACVLVSETSCEQRNELLDRALVVPTVESAGAAFFGDR